MEWCPGVAGYLFRSKRNLWFAGGKGPSFVRSFAQVHSAQGGMAGARGGKVSPPRSAPSLTPMSSTSAASALAKSSILAALLGLVFGPIGLLYVGILPAIVMFGVNLVVGFVTFGFGLFLTWPICALVGWILARRFNARLMALG